jgi:hypothetical protein
MPSSVPVTGLRPRSGGDQAGRAAIGKPNEYVPVVSAQFLKKLLDTITVG